MDGKSNIKVGNDLRNIAIFISWLPFLGLFSSTVFGVVLFFKSRLWSWLMVVYILIPFVVFFIVFVCLKLVIWKKYKSAILIPHKLCKSATVITAMLLIIINVMLFNTQRINFTPIELEQVAEIYETLDDESTYYVLFGSNNCMYCDKMDNVFKAAFLRYKNIPVFYVDLTNVALNNDIVQKRRINQLPLLVCYSKDTEVNRLTGTAKVEAVVDFVKRNGG